MINYKAPRHYIWEIDRTVIEHIKVLTRQMQSGKMTCHAKLDLVLDDERMIEVDKALHKLLNHKPHISNSEILYRAILKAAEGLD